MANTDSFIEEVTEEVRRDRLFALMRRYGWIAILVVLLIVGGAAYFEFRRAQEDAAAQDFGDALVAALDQEDGALRVSALSSIEAETPSAQAILSMLLAAEEAGAGDPAAAAERLRGLAETADIPARYTDLALLRAQMLDPLDFDASMTLLDGLATPGRPYRALAIEQQALTHLRAGDSASAIALLEQVQVDAQASPTLQDRALQLIIALEAGSELVDASEETDTAPQVEETTAPAEDPAEDVAPNEDGESPEDDPTAVQDDAEAVPAEDADATDN